jgi:hypothetical protein
MKKNVSLKNQKNQKIKNELKLTHENKQLIFEFFNYLFFP